MFFETYKDELIITGIVFLLLSIIRFTSILLVRKKGLRKGIIKGRTRLICKYISSTTIIIFILIEGFVFGVEFKELAIIFSSVFAILGIALFAVWSILSNVTSGIILFFAYPYKVGDKIKIHDNDVPTIALIEDIGAFQLYLRLENGDLLTYPNNLILQKPVTLIEKSVL